MDIAVDGLAVDILHADELGYGNAAQVIGYKIGMLTGGGLLVWLSNRIDWDGLFVTMGVLVGLVALGTMAKQPVRDHARQVFSQPATGDMGQRMNPARPDRGKGRAHVKPRRRQQRLAQ